MPTNKPYQWLSIQQTEDLKEIAMKMAGLDKANESRPRTVVITHGKEPTIVVKGTLNVVTSHLKRQGSI